MRVLIVVPSQDRISGNWVSARRFQQGLLAQGHQATILETPLLAEAAFKRDLLSFAPDVAILLHAFRSGQPWLQAAGGSKIPFVVLLTGTDINHGLDDPQQHAIIQTVLSKATFSLLQNPLLASALSAKDPGLARNLRELPAGITLGKTPYPLRDRHHLAKDKTLFLCAAGLRPVKGVLELLEMFDQVASQNPACLLAFCGPVLDQAYGERFLLEVKKRPWASYLGTIEPQAMASAMGGADIILNNSQTEGLANSLLEAAALGIPILASKIPGNATVVQHESNGLLYANREEFVGYAGELLDPARRRQLSRPAPGGYDPERETLALIAFLQEACKAGR